MREPAFFESTSLKGKRVLIRCDLNVPFNTDGTIENDTRIRASIPTILYTARSGAKTVLMGHIGNPHGTVIADMSMKPIAQRLTELVEKPVQFIKGIIGDSVRKTIDEMKNSEIVLLENLRFHHGEENNDADFARELSLLGDMYINEAFGSEYQYSYKYHASVDKIKDYFTQPTYRLCFH